MSNIEIIDSSEFRLTSDALLRVRTSVANYMGENHLSNSYRFILKSPEEIICEEQPILCGSSDETSPKYLNVYDLAAESVTTARFTQSNVIGEGGGGRGGYGDAHVVTMLPTGINLRGKEISPPLRRKMEIIKCATSIISKEYEGP